MQNTRRSKKTDIRVLSRKHSVEDVQVTSDGISQVVLHSVFVIDTKGYYVSWSDSFQQKAAVKPLRKKDRINVIDKLIYHADQPLIKEKLLSVLSKGYEETAEARVLFQGEQELRWFMMTGRRIIIEGNPFVICMILDITARKQVEDNLIQAAHKYRAMIEHLDGAVFIADTNSILNYVSPAAENLFGFMAAEMTGKSVAGFLEEEKEIPGALAAISKTGTNHLPTQVLEWHFRRKNGSLFWGELHLQCVADKGDPFIVGLLHDITARKGIEFHSLFRTNLFDKADTCSIEELLQATLDEAERLTDSSVGFCYFLTEDMKEPDLQVLSGNSNMNIGGMEADGERGSLNQKELFVEVLRSQRTMIHNECNSAANNCNKPDDHSKFMRTLVVPILRGDMVTAIVGVGGKSSNYDDYDECVVTSFAELASDLVLRKRAEQSEMNINTSLIHAQKMAFVGNVIKRIGSNYSQMLDIILGNVKMAMDHQHLSISLVNNLREILETTYSSSEMMSQLLIFARSGAVMPIVLELNILVEGKMSAMRELVGEQISLDWIPDRQKTLVKIDPSQIDQLLAIFCFNARDAITGKGHITIETSRIFIDPQDCAAGHTCLVPGNYVKLVVTDNGIGIEKQNLSHIFEPFFTTRDAGKAMGLGLSIAYGIAKQNQGYIECQTELGKGSVFTLYFPRYMGNNYFSEDEDPIPSLELKETILLVEDEPDTLNLYKRMLEKAGYTIHAFDTPDKALRFATEYQCDIDLLLVDAVLPEMNGCDLSKKLLAICPKLKTLFMSGSDSVITARNGFLEEGVEVGFIRKPFLIKELTIKINELFSSATVVQ